VDRPGCGREGCRLRGAPGKGGQRREEGGRPLSAQHFAEFDAVYGKDPNGRSPRTDGGETGRSRPFTLADIKARDYKLDITWLKDESLEDGNELPEPQDLAAEAITELEAVVDDLREIIRLIEREEGVE
jgi:type I restriction enzyme M protein